MHYAGAKVLITSLIGFALGPFSVINHFGFLEVIKHVLKFVASQCLRCNVKCFVGGYPDRPYNEESHIVVCSRQHCRLTICIELVELTNSETAAATPSGGGARSLRSHSSLETGSG